MSSDYAAIVTQTVRDGRKLIESLMLDECAITRAGVGKGEWNDGTGQYDSPTRTTSYEGKCRIQIASVMGDASSVDAGERDGTTQGSVVQLPVLASGDVAVNDVVEITACLEDPSLEGRKFTITGRHGKSQATARRLRMVEVVA